MVERKGKKKKKKHRTTPVRATDEPSSSITVDPTTLTEKEES